MSAVTNIYLKENISLVTLADAPANSAFLERVFGDIAAAGINVDMISQTASMGGLITISFTVDGEDMVKVLSLNKRISSDYPQVKPLVSSGHAKISLFSENMPNECGVAARVFTALSQADIEIDIISTSETDVSLLMGASAYMTAYSKLKEAFGL